MKIIATAITSVALGSSHESVGMLQSSMLQVVPKVYKLTSGRCTHMPRDLEDCKMAATRVSFFTKRFRSGHWADKPPGCLIEFIDQEFTLTFNKFDNERVECDWTNNGERSGMETFMIAPFPGIACVCQQEEFWSCIDRTTTATDMYDQTCEDRSERPWTDCGSDDYDDG